ncbi:hypothetical protein, partial [Salmonella sp. M241]|uniref:hypothetical protein n=1 Tax=Salmonella sp. M241 TaxID=3240299 RepID=UPI00352AD01B
NEALNRLWRLSASILAEAGTQRVRTDAVEKITALLHDDLGTPQALAYLGECLKDDELLPKEKAAIIDAAEPVLGLLLTNPPEAARK